MLHPLWCVLLQFMLWHTTIAYMIPRLLSLKVAGSDREKKRNTLCPAGGGHVCHARHRLQDSGNPHEQLFCGGLDRNMDKHRAPCHSGPGAASPYDCQRIQAAPVFLPCCRSYRAGHPADSLLENIRLYSGQSGGNPALYLSADDAAAVVAAVSREIRVVGIILRSIGFCRSIGAGIGRRRSG